MSNVVIKSRVQAYNIDALNRTAKCASEIDNGCVFKLTDYVTGVDGEDMVWNATAAGDIAATGLWMATSPEVVITHIMDGVDFKGIVKDPRAFKNLAGQMIDATFLMAGDIIEMTGDGITGISTEANVYLAPAATGFTLVAQATAGTGFSMRRIGKSYLHIGQAGIAATPIVTYKYVVEKN